jgi:hypothetical protein
MSDLPSYTVFIPKGAKQSECWHIKFRHDGKQIMRSLKTADRVAAEREAKELVQRTVAPTAIWGPELEAGGPTIAAVVEIYLQQEQPKVETRAQNVRDLCRLVQVRFQCDRHAAMSMPVAVLNARTVDAFVRERQGGRIRKDRILPMNLSINSTINHAKGVFAARVLPVYRQAGLEFPASIHELLNYPPLPERQRGRLARKFLADGGLEVAVWIEDGMIRWESNQAVVAVAESETSGCWAVG